MGAPCLARARAQRYVGGGEGSFAAGALPVKHFRRTFGPSCTAAPGGRGERGGGTGAQCATRLRPKRARLLLPRAWAGFFFAQGRSHQRRRDFSSWPAETSEL